MSPPDSTVSSSLRPPALNAPKKGGLGKPPALKCPAYKLPVSGLPDRLTTGHAQSKKDLRSMDAMLKRVGSDPGPGHYKDKEKADDVVHHKAPQWSYKAPKPGVSRSDNPGSQKSIDAMYEVCTALDKVRPAPKVWTWPKGPGHRVETNRSCAPPASVYTPVKSYVDAEQLGGVAICGAVQRLGSRCKKVSNMAAGEKKTESRKTENMAPKGPGPGYYKVSHAYTEEATPIWGQSKTDNNKVRFMDVAANSKLWVPPPGKYEVMAPFGKKDPLSH